MKRIRNLLFGLGVFATLGFGAATARAEVGTIESRIICPFVRSAEECTDCCASGDAFGTWDGATCTCS
jgi:hypothetical protein